MFFSVFFSVLWVVATAGMGVKTAILFEEAYDWVDYLKGWALMVLTIASASLMISIVVEAAT